MNQEITARLEYTAKKVNEEMKNQRFLKYEKKAIVKRKRKRECICVHRGRKKHHKG